MKITPFDVAIVEGDTHLSKTIEEQGRIEVVREWIEQRFGRYIPEGGVVCDVGACLGDHTLTYSRLVGPSGKVYAYEPNQVSLECLHHNTKKKANIQVRGVGLGKSNSTGEMVQNPNLGMAHISPGGAIQIRTLDEESTDWTRLDFLKIDVEGFEPDVIDGGRETIKRFRPVMLIEANQHALHNYYGKSQKDIYQRLDELGYNYAPCRPGETINSPEIDLLCIPKERVNNRPRFHLLALPNVQTTKAYSLDGFAMATIKMAKMLKELGHYVTLYASEENEAPCDELVTVITKEEQETLLGDVPYQYAGFFGQKCYPLWALANGRMIREIFKRKQDRDFILTIGGVSQEDVAKAHPDLMSVEYSIGYVSCFSQYRVYESHIWRAMTTARQGSEDGRFFDTVIPLFFDEDEFQYNSNKEPFLLYVGRLTIKKGLEISCRAAESAGVQLNVIGHGDKSLVTHGAKYLGALNMEERNNWMSRASAIIAPTLYIEPFGSVVVEAAMCGTPAITTDYGGFVETVEHGKTGFRCSYLGEFVRAIKDVKNLDLKSIRKRAVSKYSIHNIKNDYQKYFERLNLLWDEGWDTI